MKKNSLFRIVIKCLIVGFLIISSSNSYANFDDSDYELAITEKRYNDALKILTDKDEEKQTIPEKELI